MYPLPREGDNLYFHSVLQDSEVFNLNPQKELENQKKSFSALNFYYEILNETENSTKVQELNQIFGMYITLNKMKPLYSEISSPNSVIHVLLKISKIYKTTDLRYGCLKFTYMIISSMSW